MAFRDINPAAMNPLAYAELAAAPATQFQAGQQHAVSMKGAQLNNELMRRTVARDEATAAALAGYYDAPPDQRASALNELAGIDPTQAAQVMQLQAAQAAELAAQRQQQALQEHARAQHVLKSENPALALRLLDADGSFLRQLEEQGLIDSADGISDDEARLVAQWAADTTAPIAGIGADRMSTDVATMRELGYDLTPEGFEQFRAAHGSSSDPTAALLAQLQVDERRARLAAEERAAAEKARTDEVNRTKQRNANRRVIEQTGQIADQANSLQGTFLEVGVAGADMRRTISGLVAGGAAALGFDTTERRKVNDTYDKLKKNTADQLINLMSSGDLGEATNSKLEQYQSALASTETSLGAILSIQANIAEIALEQADAEGWEVKDREAIERRIAELRGYETPADAPVVDVPAATRAVGGAASAAAGKVMELGNGVRLEFLDDEG